MLIRLTNSIIQAMFAAVFMILQIFFTQILPALFFVGVWLTEQILTLIPWSSLPVQPGKAVLVSVVLWTITALVIFPLSMGTDVLFGPSLIWILLLGSIWGLTVGGTIARNWSSSPLSRPQVAPSRKLGINPDMLTPDEEEENITIEDLLRGGAFVGKNVGARPPQDDETNW